CGFKLDPAILFDLEAGGAHNRHRDFFDAFRKAGATMAGKSAKAASVTRLVLVGILILAAGLLFFDRRARSAAQAASDLIGTRLPTDEQDASSSVGTPNMDEVHDILGRQPVAVESALGGEKIEVYSWSSPIRTYRL